MHLVPAAAVAEKSQAIQDDIRRWRNGRAAFVEIFKLEYLSLK